MNLGLIADIHADVRALEATLRHLDALGANAIVCAGDVVGYGNQPDATVALLKARAIPCIRGNHDRWALERRQVIGIRGWTRAKLADDTWQFLESLPPSLRIEQAGRTIAVYHGSPESDTEFVSPYKAIPESVNRFRAAHSADLLVLGHTHLPMIERDPAVAVLNPGSVLGVTGVQTSYSFALLDLESMAMRIYDVRTCRVIRRDPIVLEDE